MSCEAHRQQAHQEIIHAFAAARNGAMPISVDEAEAIYQAHKKQPGNRRVSYEELAADLQAGKSLAPTVLNVVAPRRPDVPIAAADDELPDAFSEAYQSVIGGSPEHAARVQDVLTSNAALPIAEVVARITSRRAEDGGSLAEAIAANQERRTQRQAEQQTQRAEIIAHAQAQWQANDATTDLLDGFATPYRLKAKKPDTSIMQRWKERVLAAGLHQHGEAGAAAYLDRYGKGIALPKVVALALCAEHEGAPEMARGFWRKAYALKTGTELAASGMPEELPSTATSGSVTAPRITLPEFPDTLQPGYLQTMQAVNPQIKDGRIVSTKVDAMPTPEEVEQARALLIEDDNYWAQPKRDGERRAVWGGTVRNAYQARSNNQRIAPSPEIDDALRAAARQFGTLTLDGEVFFSDVAGGEHRTASQAFEANKQLGQPEAPTPPRYAVFTALYADGQDLRESTQRARVEAGERIGRWLENRYPGVIELVPTARTRAEKAALCAKQKAEGREGEVWARQDCTYRGGKQKGGDILRTKYNQEVDVVVTGVTQTAADGRAFGALQVGVYNQHGTFKSLGEVGTGFNVEEQQEILRRVQAGEKIVVTVTTQGRTEKGKLWAGRFKDIRSDKTAAECVEATE